MPGSASSGRATAARPGAARCCLAGRPTTLAVKDTTPEGAPAVNPIAGFQAAADPTLRAGTHGLFYLSGIAFNRAEEANGTSSALARRRGREVGRAVRLGVHRRQRFVGSQQAAALSAHDDRRLGNERALSRQALDHRRHSPRPRHLHHSRRPERRAGGADDPERHGLHRLRDVPRQRQQSAQRRLGEELQ